jgi:hypothetical protein
MKTKIENVKINDIELLKKNARVMPKEKFNVLVDNLKKDGSLTSVPLCVRDGEKYIVISSNHRVMAAKEAGIKEISVMVVDEPISKSKQLALQLSHNSLNGIDNEQILKDLYNEIDEINDKNYSGLSDDIKTGEKTNPMFEKAFNLEYEVISFAFLKPEAEMIKKFFEQPRENYPIIDKLLEPFIDVIADEKELKHIKSSSTAFLELIEKAKNG